MNLKRVLVSTVAAASLLFSAGIASAAWEMNIYGASAQFNFWNTNGQAFLEAQNCTGVQKATVSNNQVIFEATCPAGGSFGTGGLGYLRAASKASYDGCYAAKGEDGDPINPQDPDGYAPGRDTTCDPNYNQRPMINEATCTWGGTCSSTLVCKTVTVGASDVPCECFVQESHGLLKGHLAPGTANLWQDRKYNSIDMTGVPVCRPMVVTFAPFANNSVKKGGVPITNISRDNMELIFSGQVYNWADIVDTDGAAYDAKDILVCLRHAGSGTHASLDAYLNSPLIFSETQPSPQGMLFEEGTGDMMACLNQANVGGIGYADADRANLANTVRLTLNGVGGNNFAQTAAATIGGQYNFYGVQHLYGSADELCAYLNNPARVPDPFVAECELIYPRTGGNPADPCAAFPIAYRGNVCP
jgi:hypothetical protein